MPPPLGLKDLVFASFALLIPSFATRLRSPISLALLHPRNFRALHLPLFIMPASASTKSASAKGKKAATPAQLRAAAREELSALFTSAPGGSIAGEEEFAEFARRVLAQLAIIGDGEYTEEVAYQAMRLVRDTMGFATGVEAETVDADVPWTHPLYRQAFAAVQAQLAAECADREGEGEEPTSAAEVEGEGEAEVDELDEDEDEVVEAAAPAPRTRSKRKAPPRPAAKAAKRKSKRAQPADESTTASSPKKKARTDSPSFPEPVWRPATAEPLDTVRCVYCAAHPGGGRCVLREGFPKCDQCLLGRQGCWAPGSKSAPYSVWYEDEGYTRAVRLDGVIAAKVIRACGRASDMPGWVKAAWEKYRAARLAAYEAGEGSLGDSTANEASRPPSAKSSKVAAPAKTARVVVPGSGSSSKLSH
ncbi:hypothetical protein FKP32DRAFT_1674553, partial [Trametes sanguinea]